MSHRPRLSVIVPAYQGEAYLPRTLGALVGSDLPREEWELIVVDDGSSDGTTAVAGQWADRVVTLPGPPQGPAHVRNRGAVVARGEWLAFVDADVLVHADTLRRILEVVAGTPDLVAVFGSYDDNPLARGFVSQFRNLLHRYVHLRGAGETDTFWAGCGAVRREAFLAAGGFNAERFPKPQIEDIELGYRLRDRGGKIQIEPTIQGAHLKHWTFWGGTRTDLLDRGIPWVRLLLERGGLGGGGNLNLKGGERLKTGLVGLALASLLLTPWLGLKAGLAGLVLLIAAVLSNVAVLRWFAGLRGSGFALRAAGLMIWYHAVSGLAVFLGVGAHWLGLGRRSQTGEQSGAGGTHLAPLRSTE